MNTTALPSDRLRSALVPIFVGMLAGLVAAAPAFA
jgi:hypothetical protein